MGTPRSLTMAPLPGRATTPSTSLTEGSSTSTTTPTTLMDMLPRSLTMALLPSPLPSLVSVMASPTVVWSVMASPMVASSATVLELPTEEWLILAEKHARDLHIYLFVNKYEIGDSTIISKFQVVNIEPPKLCAPRRRKMLHIA